MGTPTRGQGSHLGTWVAAAPEPPGVQLAFACWEGGPKPSPLGWQEQSYHEVGVPVGERCPAGHRLGALTSAGRKAKQLEMALSGPGAG